jgi:cupin fold WbuC family metalloprotein
MKTISLAQLQDLTLKASQSARGRAHLNVHDSAEDVVQRFFVAVEPRSYIRPHRHLTRAELVVVLRGRFEVLTFNDLGTLLARHAVGEGAGLLAFETPPGTWHTLLSDAPGTVFLEVTEGPYAPATAVEFATWAPAEGSPEAPGQLETLRNAEIGQSIPK